jgi:dsRNA-specific ribonuclease
MITGMRSQLSNNVLPEYLNWATSAQGIQSARQPYETLESYGDTVLKLAATMLAYEWKKDDRKAGEGDIENMKVAFITNFHLFRVGFNMRLHRHIKTMKDPDSRDFVFPLTEASQDKEKVYRNKCVGKAISDSVEAMIGALYLTAANPSRE